MKSNSENLGTLSVTDNDSKVSIALQHTSSPFEGSGSPANWITKVMSEFNVHQYHFQAFWFCRFVRGIYFFPPAFFTFSQQKMITGLIQATDLPRENSEDGETVAPSWRVQPRWWSWQHACSFLETQVFLQRHKRHKCSTRLISGMRPTRLELDTWSCPAPGQPD